MGEMGEEKREGQCAQHSLMMGVLERIEEGVKSANERLLRGDVRFAEHQMRLNSLETSARENEQIRRTTLQTRDNRAWEIAKQFIFAGVGALLMLLGTGAKSVIHQERAETVEKK